MSWKCGGNTLLPLLSRQQNRFSQLHIEKQWDEREEQNRALGLLNIHKMRPSEEVPQDDSLNKTATDGRHHSLFAK